MQRTKHQKALVKQRQRRYDAFMAAGNIQFTCSNCGADVPWRYSDDARDSAVFKRGSHDACLECEWSQHIAYGTDDLPPCGAMMEPVRRWLRQVQDIETGELTVIEFVVRRCQGCGWETEAPTQEIQANGYDHVSLTRFGKDGNGKVMESEFADHQYRISAGRNQ